MVGRIYAITFILLILLAFWVQKRHLEQASKEFNAQLDSENLSLPTSTIKNFFTRSYTDGALKYTFSGNKITYYTDGHFEAEGSLVYSEFDENNKNILTISTEKAVGQMESSEEASDFVSGNNQLKYVDLPGDVYFVWDDNKGKTSDVHFDPTLQTLESTKDVESEGPQGTLHGTGFYYLIKDEEFKIRSQVSGKINIENSSHPQ